MAAQTVTLIRGDGVLRELVEPVVEVLEAAGASIQFDEQPAGRSAYQETGHPLPASTVESIRRNGVALKGKLYTPQGSGYESPNAALRKQLDLFATVRPVHNVPGLPSRHQDIDLVIVRESTEDVYAGLEHHVTQGVVASLKVITERASERIVRFAFEYARQHGRKKVTAVHKANIMKVTDGLFLRTARRIAEEEYPEIAFNALIVDNASMQLLMRPHQYDVIVAGNMYGDILSDLAAGIVGGISAVYGASYAEGLAVFEAIHGDAPHLEGTGVANPLPLLNPACYMLQHIGQHEAARRIRQAVGATLAAGTDLTPDLGGRGTTVSMTRAIIANLPRD